MVKLFLRIFSVTLVNILLVFVCIYFSMTIFVGPPPIDYRPTADLVVRLLERSLAEQETDGLDATRQLFDEKGIAHRLLPRDAEELPPEFSNRVLAKSRFIRLPNHHETMIYLPLGSRDQVLAVGPFASREGPPTHMMPLVFGVVVLVVGLGAMLLTRPAWSNIKRFESATARLAEGDWSARAEHITIGPAVTLARRFNKMAAALERYIENQKHLFQAVAHELRTPVARIHFELEMLEIAKDEAARGKRTEAIVGHLNELEGLLSELLVFTRLEGEPHQDLVPFTIGAALQNLCGEFSRGSDKQLTLQNPLPEDYLWHGDQRLFRRAVGNLVQNALRYAAGSVVVGVSLTRKDLLVTVDDDGPGVPAEQREHVFEPFARIEKSRDKRRGGVGLGLAIVARILQRHHGSVHIEVSPQGGARFVTSWPLKSESGAKAHSTIRSHNPKK